MLRRAPVQRYKYFVSRIAVWEYVWGLTDGEDGWILLGDEDGSQYVPIWPHDSYASRFAQAEGMPATPNAIHLDEWLADVSPRLLADRVEVALFPIAGEQAPVIDVTQLEADLRKALADME